MIYLFGAFLGHGNVDGNDAGRRSCLGERHGPSPCRELSWLHFTLYGGEEAADIKTSTIFFSHLGVIKASQVLVLRYGFADTDSWITVRAVVRTAVRSGPGQSQPDGNSGPRE